MAEWGKHWGEGLWGEFCPPVSNYVEGAIDLLAGDLRCSPKMICLITIWAERMQSMENVIWQFRNLYDCETTGTYGLDILGCLLGIQRLGLPDEDYRVCIKAMKCVINDRDNPKGMLECLRILVNDDTRDIDYEERLHNYFIITVEGLTNEEYRKWSPILKLFRPMTYCGVFCVDSPDSHTTCDVTGAVPPTAGGELGNASEPPSYGGTLSYLVPIF